MEKYTFEQAAEITKVSEKNIIDFFMLTHCINRVSDRFVPTVIGLNNACIADNKGNAILTANGIKRVVCAFSTTS